MATTPLRVDGVDMHHKRPDPNLKHAKEAGLKWLYHKATEGNGFLDTKYELRRALADEAELPFGAYHFARPIRGDARQEARFFLRTAKPVPGELRPMLDLEDSGGLSLQELRAWAKEFIAVVKRKTGVLPLVYTPFDLGPVTEGCIVWRARYNTINRPPELPWDIFQFSNGVLGVPHSFPGIGPADLNHMRDGLTVKDMRIPLPPKPPRPAKPDTLFRIEHASQHWPDTNAETRADIRSALSTGAEVITFSEVYAGSGNLRILEEEAERAGYTVVQEGGEVAIAVAPRVSITDQGTTLVNKGQKGEPPKGGHSQRNATWVQLSYLGEEIFVVVSHWVTGYGDDPERTEEHEAMSTEVVRLVQEHGVGAKVAFFTGDTNVGDKAELVPGFQILDEGDLVTCWDEAGVYPPTHGGRQKATIDVIGSYDPDVRVSLEGTPTALNVISDHHRIGATYRIKARQRG